MAPILAVLVLLIGVGCAPSAQVAEYIDASSGSSVAIEIHPAHPTLAEHERVLILRTKGSQPSRHRLAMDTGGYSAANLYSCTGAQLMLDSYGELVTLDSASGLIKDGPCAGQRRYLGVFDGGGSKPWQFFPASARPEEALVMSGG